MFEIKKTSVSYLTEQKSQPIAQYRQRQYSQWKQAPGYKGGDSGHGEGTIFA